MSSRSERILSTAHFIVDGQRFGSARAVFRAAKERGYAYSASVIARRLTAGKNTWAEILAPLSEARSIARIAQQKKRRDDMTDVIRVLDARKGCTP